MENEWDVFVSHASEDKEAVVRPLASRLRRLGMKVWIDENELKVGDSLSRKIDEGLAKSRAGVVVLSSAFFRKQWPEYELRGLNARVLAGGGMLLPIWHKVTHADVTRFSPTLADALALNTVESFDQIALKITAVVQPDLHRAIMRKIARALEIRDATVKYISIRDIEIGPIRHSSLPRRLVNRIELVSAALQDVLPRTIDQWMDGFQRDTHPTSEIEIWEDIAVRYQRATITLEMSLEQKADLYAALLLASLGDSKFAGESLIRGFGDNAEAVLKSMRPDPKMFSALSPEDAASLAQYDSDIEDHAGPESEIDINYINDLIAGSFTT